jgi:NAD+ synthase (glutamine-hydrolysing)
MNSEFGLVEVEARGFDVSIGNCAANAAKIIDGIKRSTADIIVFPELSITGYTCGDLFHQTSLIGNATSSLLDIAATVGDKLVFVGLPICINGALYNCVAALNNFRVIGIVPKSDIANYKEFYEARWFTAAKGNLPKTLFDKNAPHDKDEDIPFGTDLIFQYNGAKVFAEICESLWTPIPPSSRAAIAGANIIVNPSASNSLVYKNEYREQLIANQSGRCIAAYVYSNTGSGESSTDTVYLDEKIIAYNGGIIASKRTDRVSAVVDIEKLEHDRMVQTSFSAKNNEVKEFRYIGVSLQETGTKATYVSARPFVTTDPKHLDEIIDIQTAGLQRRYDQTKIPFILGLSGGLDSTLAFLIAHRAGVPFEVYTMPGFGTSTKTLGLAKELAKAYNVKLTEIDIRPTCFQMWKDMKYSPFGIDITEMDLWYFLKHLMDVEGKNDLTFENVQARVRTAFLMNSGKVVIGTGDLSEIALGWSTYNGDHISHYNVNASIPKTLVKTLVERFSIQDRVSLAGDTLINILDLPFSPELLPLKDGKIAQETEKSIGSYVLHDFFLFHFLRNGFSPKKIMHMACQVKDVPEFQNLNVVRETLKVFLKRFFSQQFKRDCVPAGPKVGSVSLSPRGDWRGIAEADVTQWIKELE